MEHLAKWMIEEITKMFGDECYVEGNLIWLGGYDNDSGDATTHKLVLKTKNINSDFVNAMKECILLSEWLYDSKLMVSDDILLILYIDCHCEYPTANKIIELFPYDTFTEFTPYNTNTVNGHDHLPHMCWIGSSHIADALCSPHI